nr:MAG TPA: hypothetical protein [Caudoviricetes sp.]
MLHISTIVYVIVKRLSSHSFGGSWKNKKKNIPQYRIISILG